MAINAWAGCRWRRKGAVPGSAAVLLLLAAAPCRGQQGGAEAAASVESGTAAEAAKPAALQQAIGARRTGLDGVVTDARGALAEGALVQLQQADGTTRTQKTDRDGYFVFDQVVAGKFTLAVTLPGFDEAVVNGTLRQNQRLDVSMPPLQLSTFSVSVDAVASPEELSLEQMHAEEHQRLLGVLPNFFVSYNWKAPPLTTRQKFTLATKNVLDPGNLFLVGTVAGVQQATNAFPGYRQGAAGYGKRYGADLANLVVGTYMGGAILPTLFRQDPRYFYKGTGSLRSRFFYAVSTAFVCRGDNGHRQPAFASMLGDLSAGAISNLYYAPSDRQGATLTFENGLLGIAGDAMNNVFQEFVLKKLTSKDH